MVKAKFSPSTILTKAIEIYLRDENITIEQVIKSKQEVKLKLSTIAFALKTILSYHGYRVETVINEDNIILKSAGVPCYEIKDEQFIAIQSVSSLCFQLVMHWGLISTQLDKIGQVPDKAIKNKQLIQTALPV